MKSSIPLLLFAVSVWEEAPSHALAATAIERGGSRAALAANPELAGSHFGIAFLHMQAEPGAEAIPELDEELRIAPESAVAKALNRRLETPHP